MQEMLYLGHVISANGVQVHMEKIRVILDWPTPKNVTELKGLLGLHTYYRRYVKGFSQFTAPLTDLTKKGAFSWTEGAQQTFEKMKNIMSSCPILALPDFTQPFVVECDASWEGGQYWYKTTIWLPLKVYKLKIMDATTLFMIRKC